MTVKPPNRLATPFRRYSNASSLPIQRLQFLVGKCTSVAELKLVHAQIILRGYGEDAITLSKVISVCALSPFGDVVHAHYLFDKIPNPNRHMYNTMIRASSGVKSYDEVIRLYQKMVCSGASPNEFTFPFILKACGNLMAYRQGVVVHSNAVKTGFSESHVFVQNGLVNFYIGCGRIECARKVFDGMEFRTLVSWNSMIGGYAKFGGWREAFSLFCGMREDGVMPDGHTFVSLLSVCSIIRGVVLGKFVHWFIEANAVYVDVYVHNALLDMYAKCGDLQMAKMVFDRIPDKTVVSWTSFVSAYAKHGFVELAESTFNRMPVKNVVSWNSMISCYLLNGHYRKCIELFRKMCDLCFVPDETTVVSVLSACSHTGDLVTGKKLHDYLCGIGMEPTIELCNSLMDMYAKCGLTEKALEIFLNMPEKNVVSWNTVINALALHGHGDKAVELFQEMEASGTQPDAATFGGLLSACCHCGNIEIGRYFFSKMRSVYGIRYDIEHYACMVDILGRRGLLKEALRLVGEMEMRPDVVIWGSVLGACRTFRNVPIAKMVLKQVLELEPCANTGGLYVLLANVFFEDQRWDEAKKVRKLMRSLGVRKSDAVSSIEVGGRVFEFMVSDERHEASDLVYATLHRMKDHLKSECQVFLFAGGTC
ncbi:pentatricopeptide repeat-containing protein At2g22410, mitochondrial-like [Andrographis paniculata]|uniref:pentatricopeptide repeat-containing protein At2g22410, mitochondrial-like n=1 Tax=Andrographis paniculata TaxID=175694 RepID=UPI0021E6EF29|nr:pentatricopeptide repeat-containing protein At2g22410, mitochondrial-like [Andrographis paniculata]